MSRHEQIRGLIAELLKELARIKPNRWNGQQIADREKALAEYRAHLEHLEQRESNP
jgi:hypothetical protein